uniref:NR LBD domain-containing protein n=1 Tax=Pelusios castaneus TaxID=367368 RepID=A0A8C8SN92_9SAUR
MARCEIQASPVKYGKCQCETNHPQISSAGCPCESNRKVVLKTPEVTCMRASEVLLKTVTFIRNLPSFYHLPQEDQVLLVQQCWAPLFVLGLAQEWVSFELKEISVPSLLKKILLNQSLTDSDKMDNSSFGASLAEVQKMKNFLEKFWNLDICSKEYAYLKGIILFNPGKFHCSICMHKQEAQRTLKEFISMMYNSSLGRFAWILGLLTSLKAINAETIAELFFRPILGEVNLNEFLLETLYFKPSFWQPEV